MICNIKRRPAGGIKVGTMAVGEIVQIAVSVPEFVQPTGSNDAYKKGDKVSFENKVYESTIDNNVWSPAAYPAGWKEIER